MLLYGHIDFMVTYASGVMQRYSFSNLQNMI